MADKDKYVTGQGMFGGVKGSYGRYGVSRNVSNLSPAQFNSMDNVEEQQMRRYKRRYEPGYSGAGFWVFNYPYMTGALGAGSITQTQGDKEPDNDRDDSGATANPGTGMGEGGTAASASGAAGGSPA